ncbi:pyridoxal phosphate-dependent aminotransferase [Candidatus Woesearchaeota archaeon]|nr:pyridoxal phosphate-dependent aminotransferase [Candidatus Woesearchaeota archaeon]
MISERARQISPSETLAITAKAKKLKAEGKDVIAFAAGEPDFFTPDNVKAAGKKAIDNNFTRYTPASGIPELKEAICNKFKRENNLDYAPENIITSNGGKHSLYTAFQAIIDKGDEVLLPVPYWVSYVDQIRLAEGTPVFVESGDDFKITAEQLKSKLTKKTKAIVLNSPSNPSGAVIDDEELRKIADFAVKNNLFVISDEVYEHFIYNGKHTSIASLNSDIKKLTITVNAMSKTYSMTGWRIGYCAAEKEIVGAMNALQSHMTSNPCSVSQMAAVEALNGQQDSVRKMKAAFEKRRDLMVSGLNKIQGISCKIPEGAFYTFPSIKGLNLSNSRELNKISGTQKSQGDFLGSRDFTMKLLNEKYVGVVPGTAFGREGHIRLSYACSEEDIKRGLERIREFVEGL